jgi:K+-sensing histidine kinase KdpD
MVLASEWLARQKHQDLAALVYLAALTAFLFALAPFGNGVTGNLVVALVLVPVVAQLIRGQRGSSWAILVGLLYMVMLFLEAQGVVKPVKMTSLALYASSSVFFLGTLAAIALILSVFSQESQRALATAQQRGRELIKANHLAQQSAQAAQAAQEHEENSARQLRRAVQAYSTFLDHVMAGDYAALGTTPFKGATPQLALDEEVRKGEGGQELVALEGRLNATVTSLVSALRDLQAVQQRYSREAWQGYATGASVRGFEYRNASVAPSDQAWLPSIAQAVQSKRVAADESELALPVTLRGEVIGAMAARRADKNGWTDDDIALAQSVTDQLAQTIEGLRLLDETERRAAREQTLGRMTAEFARSLDIDTILQTVVRELGQTLPAAEITVQVGSPSGAIYPAKGEGEL